MAQHRPTTHVASNEIQRKALASPLRLEIVSFFEHGRELSVRDVANRLGRPVASLYFHVHKLVRSGLLVESATRGSGPAAEVLYRAIAERIALPVHSSSPAAMDAVVKAIRALLRQVSREFETVCRTPDLIARQGGAQAVGRRQRVWLTNEDAAEVRKRLDAVERFLMQRSGAPGGTEYTWTSMFLPVIRRRQPGGQLKGKGKK